MTVVERACEVAGNPVLAGLSGFSRRSFGWIFDEALRVPIEERVGVCQMLAHLRNTSPLCNFSGFVERLSCSDASLNCPFRSGLTTGFT